LADYLCKALILHGDNVTKGIQATVNIFVLFIGVKCALPILLGSVSVGTQASANDSILGSITDEVTGRGVANKVLPIHGWTLIFSRPLDKYSPRKSIRGDS
jgi:hypothetical protein